MRDIPELDEHGPAPSPKAPKPEAIAAHQEFYRRRDLYSNTAAIELVMDENRLDRDRAVDVVATVMENREVFFGRVARAGHQGDASSNHGGKSIGGSPQGAGHGNTATIKEDFRKLHDLIETGFGNLDRYVKKHGDAIMAGRCLWLLLGFPRLAGASDLASLVKLLGRDKQTVNKCLQYFQAEMPSLPILEGQRCEAARATMKKAREEQLPVQATPAIGKMDMRLNEKLVGKS